MADNDMQANELTETILRDLHSLALGTATRAAETRAEYANKVKGLQESHGLNGKAFKMASTIRKIENGKRERYIRDLLTYMKMLGCDQQQDLLDRMENNTAGKVRSPLDKALDGEPVEAAADSEGKPVQATVTRLSSAYTPASAMGRHTLKAYSETVRDTSNEEDILKGLEAFSEDHPKLAEEARLIATNRIRLLGMEQGGGEDLRPTALREGKAQAAEQAADTGKRAAREKKAGAKKATTTTRRKAAGGGAQAAAE